MRRHVVVALAGCAVTVLLVGVTLMLGTLTAQDRLPEDFRLGSLWFVIPVYPLVVAAVGTLISSRRPENLIGWLMCATAVLGALIELGLFYSNYSLTGGASKLIAVEWVAWLSRWVWLPWLALQLVYLPLLFPEGRLPSRRWAWLLWIASVTALIGVIGRALNPDLLADVRLRNPVAVPDPHGDFQRLAGMASLALILLALASLTSVFVRLRNATGDRRQQLKWFGSAIAVLVTVMVAVTVADEALSPSFPLLEVVLPTIYVTIPIAIGFSVLRYRLYDIDLVINRTLVYGMLAAFISGVYLVLVVGVGALAGMGTPVNLLPLLAAGVVALAFQPARVRTQRLADRLVYGRRTTPYDTLAALSRQAAEVAPGEQLLLDTMRSLCTAVGARYASVWLRGGTEWRCMAHWPPDAKPETPFLEPSGRPAAGVFPVHNQGAVLGAISVTVQPGRTLSSADQRLLSDIAGQTGLLFRNLGLAADLMARLGELRESRRRLVHAQEEERRRIERNLHDGAQQDLFSLKVGLRQVRSLLPESPDGARAVLESLEAEAEKALFTIKELARGVYPPLLTAQGIVAALSARARTATVDVRITSSGVGRYAADVEEAIYYTCAEALQNAVQHARPTAVRISLAQRSGVLTFKVQDDGRGFDVEATTPGTGIQSMQDRIDVAGGWLEIVSRLGLGTTVTGRLRLSPLLGQPDVDGATGDGQEKSSGATIALRPKNALRRRSRRHGARESRAAASHPLQN